MEQVRKVIDTAWGMFRRFGVRSVSMDDVAREMSISKKTLYRCFRDKNELITKTLDKDLEMIETKVNEIIESENNPIRQVIRIAQYVSEYLKDSNPSMLYDLQKYHPEIHAHFINYRQNAFMEKVKNNLKNGMNLGFYRNNLDIETTANLYLCLMDHGPEILSHSPTNKNYTANLYLCLMDHGPEILSHSPTNKNYHELYIDIMKYHLHAIATPKGLEEAKTFLQ